jgi:hypothetical protein
MRRISLTSILPQAGEEENEQTVIANQVFGFCAAAT